MFLPVLTFFVFCFFNYFKKMQLASREGTGWFLGTELHVVRARQQAGLRQLGCDGQ